jgi:Trypsin-like peptidase domain
MRCLRLLSFLFAMSPLLVSQSLPTSGDQIVDRAYPSVVLVLVGAGDGQLAGVGSGVVVRPDGVLLTAYHVVKGMLEVQVRLKSGEIFDNVELIAVDERRDVAALRISATGLMPVLTRTANEVKPGSNVFVISNAAALPWSVSAGVVSGLRNAEEISGAGSGYRLLQFTAPVAPGSSGGLLIDTEGRALGIILGSLSGGQNVNFAVPFDSVIGLASVSGGRKLGAGAALRMPGLVAASNQPRERAEDAKPVSKIQGTPLSVNILSKTVYLRRERMQEELLKNSDFKTWGFRLANYGETANLGITVDRPFLTFEWTYVLVQQPEGLLLAAGIIEAADEYDASPKLAAAILRQLHLIQAGGISTAVATTATIAPRQATAPASTASGGESSVLRAFKKMYVESHTIYLKGQQLQDALYVRPEVRDWGISIVDDKSAADVWVNVTRPFLTFDWVYTVSSLRSGEVLAKGKVIAWDGPLAAPQLAAEIVKDIRNARPLPHAGE